jgi:hypothetical protein
MKYIFHKTLIALVILLAGFLPLIGAIAAGMLGNALGCKVDESDSHPCLLFGIDIGEILYSIFVLGWAFLLTIPSSFIIFILYVFLILYRKIFKAKNS